MPNLHLSNREWRQFGEGCRTQGPNVFFQSCKQFDREVLKLSLRGSGAGGQRPINSCVSLLIKSGNTCFWSNYHRVQISTANCFIPLVDFCFSSTCGCCCPAELGAFDHRIRGAALAHSLFVTLGKKPLWLPCTSLPLPKVHYLSVFITFTSLAEDLGREVSSFRLLKRCRPGRFPMSPISET